MKTEAVSARGKTARPRDLRMRRIMAEFEAVARGVPRQFRADLARALAKYGKECEPTAFARTLTSRVTVARRKLTAALKAADKQLRERAGALRGADRVLGAAGDLSRAVAGLELLSQRVSAEMTESLTELKGAGFGGQPLLTTLQIQMASLVIITPISIGTVTTVHVGGSPTADVHVDGYGPPNSSVTVVITCGGAHQTLHAKTHRDGGWGVWANVQLPASKTCTVTATAGTGVRTGSVTREIHFS